MFIPTNMRRWQFEGNHFQNGGSWGLNNALPRHWHHRPPFAALVSLLRFSADVLVICVTGGAPVKPCIHAKIHFTSTALISLQPEAHKLHQCVWSWRTNAAYGRCWDLDIQQATLSEQNQLWVLVVMFVSQFNRDRNNPVPLYQEKWQEQ